MNATTLNAPRTDAAEVTSRSPETTRTLHRVLLAALAPLLALLAIVGLAAQGHAASYGYAAKVNINSYYGAATGDATTNATRTNFYVGAYIRDVREDGYCATIQMRALTGSSASAWYNVGFNCSTSTWKWVSRVLYTSGWAVDQIQIRACQSDRYGNVIGTCSAGVNATNWHVV
jgi:hypothetical protein